MILKIMKEVVIMNEVSRQEFNDLKNDVNSLKKVFDRINSIALSTEKLAIEMKYMREEQTKMDSRITKIEEKPSKKLDLIWGYVVSAVIGGLIGFILFKLGLK